MPISITGTGTITGLSAGGLPDDCITTAEIAGSAVTTAKVNAASITAAKLDGAQTGSAPIFGARAWCRFNGTTTGTNAPTAGGNVSTVARTAAGTYTITFATAMEDANYCIQANANYTTIVNAGTYVISTSTSSCVVGHAESNAVADTAQMHVVIFR
jgi:hypothetical protein